MARRAIMLVLASTLSFAAEALVTAQPKTTNGAAGVIVRAVEAIDAEYLYAAEPGWNAARTRLLRAHPTNDVAAYQLLEQELDGLHDSDLHVLSPTQFAALQSETAGQTTGIGLIDFAIDTDPFGRPRIVTPLSGSAADKAGLRPGDLLVTIDGNSVVGLSHEQILDRLRTSRPVTLEIARAGRPLRVALRPSAAPFRSVRVFMIRHARVRVGYVGIAQFTPGTASLVESGLNQLSAAGARALVLDLRHDPGGLLDEASDVAGLFRKVDLGTKQRASGALEPIRTQKMPTHEFPLAVLIDRGTASAAEFVAAALRNTSNVALVGTETAARGQAQLYIALGSGWGIVVPSARLRTAAGRDLKAGPLEPDTRVANAVGAQKDKTLERALQYLERRAYSRLSRFSVESGAI